MFLHNKKMMYTVRADAPNPTFAKMLLEQFGGPNGELAAALRYFSQGWAETDPGRRDMLLNIATEELSHLEMVGQLLAMLTKGTAKELVDEVEGGYLGEMLNGETEFDLGLNSNPIIVGGKGFRFTDSAGTPFSTAYVDSIGQPVADLTSDIAAEVRAKIVYERLINTCDDPGARDTLNFLMTREVAHQKMFEAALASIGDTFPPGKLPGDDGIAHTYFADSVDNSKATPGFELVNTKDFPFDLKTAVLDEADTK